MSTPAPAPASSTGFPADAIIKFNAKGVTTDKFCQLINATSNCFHAFPFPESVEQKLDPDLAAALKATMTKDDVLKGYTYSQKPPEPSSEDSDREPYSVESYLWNGVDLIHSTEKLKYKAQRKKNIFVQLFTRWSKLKKNEKILFHTHDYRFFTLSLSQSSSKKVKSVQRDTLDEEKEKAPVTDNTCFLNLLFCDTPMNTLYFSSRGPRIDTMNSAYSDAAKDFEADGPEYRVLPVELMKEVSVKASEFTEWDKTDRVSSASDGEVPSLPEVGARFAMGAMLRAQRVACLSFVMHNVRRSMEPVEAFCDLVNEVRQYYEREAATPEDFAKQSANLQLLLEKFDFKKRKEPNEKKEWYDEVIGFITLMLNKAGNKLRSEVFEDALNHPDFIDTDKKLPYSIKGAGKLNERPEFAACELQRRYHNAHKHAGVRNKGHFQLIELEYNLLRWILAWGDQDGLFALHVDGDDDWNKFTEALKRKHGEDVAKGKIDLARKCLFPREKWLANGDELNKPFVVPSMSLIQGVEVNIADDPTVVNGTTTAEYEEFWKKLTETGNLRRQEIATSQWRYEIVKGRPREAYVKLVCVYARNRIRDFVKHGWYKYTPLW